LGSRQQKPQPVLEHLAAKYGLSMEEAGQMTARVAGLGAELGLTMNMAGCISAPTYDAHRLLQWAQSLGQGPAMAEILHQTHFTRNLDVSDHGVLAAAAQEAGLDQALARGVLESQAFGKDVEQDLRRAADYEITGVPFTLIGGRWGVPGAQSVDVFAETLSKP